MATGTNAAKKPRTKKNAAQLKADLEKAKKRVADLEAKAYAEELEEMVKKQNIVSSFNVVKANVKGASDIAILAAIGKAAGISRLVVTQTEPKPRASKKVK